MNIEIVSTPEHQAPTSRVGERARRRRQARGVTLVEVLIVVAIMALISGGVTLVAFPLYKKAKVDNALIGCRTVRSAAELYINIDNSGEQCPTIADLIQSKKLDPSKTDDPWGMPYKILCIDGDIHVMSFGNDKREGTADDVRDDLSAIAVKKVKDLM